MTGLGLELDYLGLNYFRVRVRLTKTTMSVFLYIIYSKKNKIPVQLTKFACRYAY